jgi:uncharacterized Zn-finger protein
MLPPETITVEGETLFCEGSDDDLGHPRVYLTMKDGSVDCPYCGRHFVLAKGAKKAAAH